ncbi:MAG: hypothetical protein JRD89_02375 [Deltaproteobacteria bacterium]|nr:hypothetical protein [Deltaproteobacteria bacterium]
MSEKLYDEKIAPKLLEIAELCEEAGLPMLATVWYDGKGSGTTRVFPAEPNPSFTLAYAAQQCHGNLDKLCFAIARQVPDEHNGSIVLRMMMRDRER